MGAAGFEGDQKDALQPFSLGPRACLGKQYVFLPLFQGFICEWPANI